MGKARAEAGRESSFDLAGQAEELTARFKGGLSRLAAGASKGAKRVKEAAHDLRTSPILQHALAARERGNLEAAFWLLNEEFGRQPVAEVALHYWDVALSLGRVDIAADAGIALVETHASVGEPELAAQHWLELVKEAPDVLVSPAAIVTLLPALKQRHAEASESGPDDRETLAGFLRRAVRHAVDPRNTGLHPGVALRLFEAGRDLNPEAARRAAEAALESPNLHETKRERLEAWLAGRPLEEKPPAPPATPAPARPVPADPDAEAPSAGLSRDEIRAAAARLPRARRDDDEAEPGDPQPLDGEGQEAEAAPIESSGAPLLETSDEDDPELAGAAAGDEEIEEFGEFEDGDDTLETDDGPAAAPLLGEDDPTDEGTGPRIRTARLSGIDDDGLRLEEFEEAALPWSRIEAVSVAEVMGLEEGPVPLVDLVLNWSRRSSERLDIVRLRVAEMDLGTLVTRKHALGSDFAALMGDILERTSAIPLPDPESALGTRITCFETPALYEQVALRISPESTP